MGSCSRFFPWVVPRNCVLSSIVRACVGTCFWKEVVPARMTWVLQLCCAHGLAARKKRLNALFSGTVAEASPTPGQPAAVISIVCKAVRHVMQVGCWPTALYVSRCGQTQNSESRTLLARLSSTWMPEVPLARPSVDGLTDMYPRMLAHALR